MANCPEYTAKCLRVIRGAYYAGIMNGNDNGYRLTAAGGVVKKTTCLNSHEESALRELVKHWDLACWYYPWQLCRGHFWVASRNELATLAVAPVNKQQAVLNREQVIVGCSLTTCTTENR